MRYGEEEAHLRIDQLESPVYLFPRVSKGIAEE